MTAPVQSVGDDRSLKVTVDTAAVQRSFAQFPRTAYFQVRDYLFGIFLQHRLAWLRAKGTQFGRRGASGSHAIKVHKINEGPLPPGPSDVVYSITPREREQPTAAAAAKGLQEMTAEVFTGNLILPVHQFGADIRARGRYLSIPVATRPGSLAAWRSKYPTKRLKVMPSKRDGKLLVYEVQTVRGRGRPKKDGGDGAPAKTKLKLRFLLVKDLHMRPTLRMYETWDGLRAERDARWKQAADAIVAGGKD